MWTTGTIVKHAKQSDTQVLIVVAYTGDADEHDQQDYVVTLADLAKDANVFETLVTAHLAVLNKQTAVTLDTFIDGLSFTYQAPTPKDPDPPDAALVAFQAGYTKLIRINRAITLGVLTGDESWVKAIKDTLISTATADFIDQV